MKKQFVGLAFAALFVASAQAATFDLDIVGWKTYGEFGAPANSESFVNLGAGSVVTSFEYLNLSFETANGSWLREFTLSLNTPSAAEFMDWRPSTSLTEGTFGPGSGSWSGGSGAAGLFGAGASFAAPDGMVWVTVYESFDDPFEDVGLELDATVLSGTLRIHYTAAVVPEPATYGLMALGLLAVGFASRRRPS